MIWRPSSYAKLIQPTTQPKQTNPQPNPNTTLWRIIIVDTYRAAQEIRPSRWVSKSWNPYFLAFVKELPRAFRFVFLLIVWIKKCAICSIWAEAILFLPHTWYILPVGNTPYRKPHNARTICTTPLQSILEAGIHSRQSFLVRLTNHFDAFVNPKNASETKATTNI